MKLFVWVGIREFERNGSPRNCYCVYLSPREYGASTLLHRIRAAAVITYISFRRKCEASQRQLFFMFRFSFVKPLLMKRKRCKAARTKFFDRKKTD